MTLADLARLAQVSTATVSRALRGDPRTAAATRERILHLAREHQYVPDPASQRLADRRWRQTKNQESVGIVAFSPGKGNEAVALEHAHRELTARGYGVTRLLWSQYPKPERLASVVRARGIHALILGEITRPDERITLDLRGCVAVACGLSYPGLSIHTVSSHPFLAVRMALNHLRDRGARKLACAVLHDRGLWSQTDVQRMAAARFELQSEPAAALYEGGFDDPAGFLAWVHAYRPDAVACHDQALWWLRDAGFAVPRDIRFASYQKSEQNYHPELSGIRIHQDLIGRRTVDCLIDLMRSHSYGETPLPIYQQIAPSWDAGVTA